MTGYVTLGTRDLAFGAQNSAQVDRLHAPALNAFVMG